MKFQNIQIYNGKTSISNCLELRVNWVEKEKSACGFLLGGRYSKIVIVVNIQKPLNCIV